METFLFYTQFSPQNTGNRLLGLCNFTIFWGSMPPDTPWKRGLLIQSVTLFKSAGYFNFYWNLWGQLKMIIWRRVTGFWKLAIFWVGNGVK